MTIEGCGFGPCVRSRERGGPGCHLCDVTAKLPQHKIGSKRGELEEHDGVVDESAAPKPLPKPTASPAAKKKPTRKKDNGSPSLL